jgi:hypothetical protein
MYLRHVKIRILEVSKTTPRTLATNKFWTLVLFIQSVQKCGSNFYTKCHKMALSKSQICSILQHSILDFFQKNVLGGFLKNFYPRFVH